MHINWWTLALQTINVLVLVWLLSRFLYRPIVAAIATRQAAADKLLADAATAATTATAHEASLQASIEAFAADADHRRAEAQASAEADRAHLLDQAGKEIVKLHAAAASTAEGERKQAGAALEIQAATLAVRMAEKLLARFPAQATTAAMFQALSDRLAGLPVLDRSRLATAAVQLVTPALLPDRDRVHYAAALTEALPGLTAPAFVVEPALIAGFELRSPELMVRNSWRADLDDLLHGLQQDAHARIG